MIACADIPALPLQLLLQAHPDWRDDPVVVVEDDRPLATILWHNRAALRLNIRRGMRFAQARALSARLHAAPVAQHDIDAAVQRLVTALLEFSPRVEPAALWPGLFFLDVSGLSGLFGSMETWAQQVHARLAALNFVASVVVGQARYTTFAVARTSTGPRVLVDSKEEREQAHAVSLSRLNVSPTLCHDMAVLGVRSLGEFLALPGRDLRIRYGEEAESLHRLASGRTWTPLTPAVVEEPICSEMQVDPPDDNHTRLLFGLKGVLHRILRQLEERSQALRGLSLTLHLDWGEPRHESIEPAAPTLDVVQVIDLLRLRFDAVRLTAPVCSVSLEACSVAVHPQQLGLLRAQKRDLGAAARALARVRAAFGHQSVTRGVLRDALLPEARFCWRPCVDLRHPEVDRVDFALRPLVRQVHPQPLSLPAMPKHEPERWLGTHGAVERMFGPYRISGGWWLKRVQRDYYFVETKTGELLWLYYDGERRRWWLQGWVA